MILNGRIRERVLLVVGRGGVTGWRGQVRFDDDDEASNKSLNSDMVTSYRRRVLRAMCSLVCYGLSCPCRPQP